VFSLFRVITMAFPFCRKKNCTDDHDGLEDGKCNIPRTFDSPCEYRDHKHVEHHAQVLKDKYSYANPSVRCMQFSLS